MEGDSRRTFKRLIMWFVSSKAPANNRNMPTQHVATLLGATCCAQLVGCCWLIVAICRVGMLRSFGRGFKSVKLLRRPNTALARALANAFQRAHKDCKKKTEK